MSNYAAMSNHVIRVMYQPAWLEWRAQCSCGWTGSYFRRLLDADAEGLRHIADIGGAS